MDFTSTGFILFSAVALLIYYIVPQKKKWIVLLTSSYLFYAICSFKGLFIIVFSTIVSFFGAKKISSLTELCDKLIEEKKILLEKDEFKTYRKEIKSKFKIKKKIISGFTITAILLILAFLKYSNFAITNINSFFGTKLQLLKLILPIGISFYTFQIVSYIFDVYYGKYKAEKNLFHYALYVSYFPSIIQGPINRYNDLCKQFFEDEHRFSLEESQFALQRILWGLLKKLVIADRAADVVTYLFNNHDVLPWFMTWCGLIFYSIKLYADFSGAMDVTIGISNLFGIRLAENFRQPFFSQSIAEFWRRWHITLGTWMKDYVFYPFSLSNFSTGITKRFSVKAPYLARVIPSSIGNLIVFFIVGVWHGAEWHYIVYGLYNAFIIILGILLKQLFEKTTNILKIKTNSYGWKIFRIIRTFLLINIGWVFDDDTTGLPMSFSMIGRAFDFTTNKLFSNYHPYSYSKLTIITVLFFTTIWFLISVLKEKEIDVCKKISSLPLLLRWAIYLGLILATPFFQASQMAGFIYAQF